MTEQNSAVERALEAIRSICSSVEATPAVQAVIAPDVRPSEVEYTLPVDDPTEWREPFVRWMDSTCALSERGASGLDVLHRLHTEWEIVQNGMPCTREVFRSLLLELCFPIRSVFETELVEGLILKEDREASGLRWNGIK
jgi:hypothetical protein